MNQIDTDEMELDEAILEAFDAPGLTSTLRGVPIRESRRRKYVPRGRPEPTIRPGVKINMLTLLEKNVTEGVYQEYANREWKCRCDCGKECIETYHRIFYGQAYSCGCRPKPRRKHVHNHSGEKHGRLIVGDWITGEGWECLCETCGEMEFVRFSNQLEEAGRDKCPRARIGTT